jgi:hypothetical protein
MVFSLFVVYVLLAIYCPSSAFQDDLDVASRLNVLDGTCIDNVRTHSWWTYIVCFKFAAMQVHIDTKLKKIESEVHLGSFLEAKSTAASHVYQTTDETCMDKKGVYRVRQTRLNFRCCDNTVPLLRQSKLFKMSSESLVEPRLVVQEAAYAAVESAFGKGPKGSDTEFRNRLELETGLYGINFIQSVEERVQCVYNISVCSSLLCSPTGTKTVSSTMKGMRVC